MDTDNATDPYELARFLDAQQRVYATALSELKAEHKRSHWMWIVFPQIDGLGRSSMARRYAISSVEEAQAYLGHPVLGARLMECTETVLAVRGRSVADIFGYPDDMKFHSSMTLFDRAAPGHSPFSRALEHCFNGKRDAASIEILKQQAS